MKNNLLIIVISFLLFSCGSDRSSKGILVENIDALNKAIEEANPGTEIVLKNGVWKDVQIKFFGKGTENQKITLRAETPGKVFIQGQSDLKLGGEYLVVDGLYFTNGASPSESVIQFYLNNDTVANNSRVTNCVIKDFNKAQRNMSDLWVLFKGRYNQLDHCYISGKTNKGPTVRINLAGNQSIKNYHKINNNHFGPRPPKGGPSGETIQLGTSSTSMVPSHTLVSNNFFEKCNGEVEVISSKTNFNEFRNNVFFKSEGSLVTRHGNFCIVDGNYFIGDENSSFVGGVRLIGNGHWVTNNYFYNLQGDTFRAPLAVMNGIRRPTINRYFQVTDVVVAYNTWVNCSSPWQFGVGSNIDQKDVLPASEIRSETPIRTIVANNIISNKSADESPIVRHDSINGIDFKSNIINNQGREFRGVEGLIEKDFELTELEEFIWIPSSNFSDIPIYNGFEFDLITNDIFGNIRNTNNSIGATNGVVGEKPHIMDMSQYGPEWYDSSSDNGDSKTHTVNTSEELVAAINNSENGDVIELNSANYEIDSSIKINKRLIVTSIDSTKRAHIFYKGNTGTPLFEMNPKGELKLKSISLMGNGENFAFATLKENMSNHYKLDVVDSEIKNFDYVLKAYKFSFSGLIKFDSSVIKNCNNGLELSAEDDDKGDYNAENVIIVNTEFDSVNKNVIDYYRGGYDESTIGGNLVVKGCSFINCGATEENGILLNTYGIVNVDLSNNTFKNNKVNQVARLWGAKNNRHTENTIENSGELIVEQNLPLKLMY
ncbi:alginate lyase [Kriegella sp. EG-1]|nr:alginate lyase [Flavobacteriaceae bacterium EG-1]